MVRFPLAGPHVLMYAVEMLPSKPPKTAHMALSRKPSPNSSGPNRPTAKLLTEIFAENHSSATEISSHNDGGMRSSGRTRVMPRASNPDRPSMRALMARRPETGFSEPGTTSWAVSLTDGVVVVASAADFSTSRITSDDAMMTCTCAYTCTYA